VGVVAACVVPLCFAVLLALGGCEKHSRYPDRPLLLICPWSVGGGTDRVSRHVAELLKHELGQPVNVINATGGQGVTGHDRGARARPDGYTLLMMTVEINMLHWQGLTDLTYRDFRPLMMINRDAAALFVRQDAPWTDLPALTEAVRADPGKLRASGTSKGGIWHLAVAGWLRTVGLGSGSVTWIGMGGAGPSLKELASQGLEIVCCSLPEAQSLLDSRLVRCVGVMAEERLPQYPGVPTFREQGIDWSLEGWRGLAAPRDVPDAVVEKLVAALTRIVEAEPGTSQLTFREFMEKQHFRVSVEAPEKFIQSLEAFDRKLGALIEEQFADAKPERFGPYFFPGVVATGLGCALLALLVGRFLRRGAAGASLEEAERAGWTRRGIAHTIEALAMVVLFILLFEPLGFILTAGALLLYLLVRFGAHPLTSLGVTLVLVPGIYEVFGRQFGVPLPRGLFGW
jgi:tripartite-type tricarboxylate transporter receptor subunit TctC